MNKYGGPYANENDAIDEALREGKLDELNVSDFSRGARALIETYKKEAFVQVTPDDQDDHIKFPTFEGNFVNNSVFHPSDDIEEVPEEEPAVVPHEGKQTAIDLDKL